MVRLVQHIRFCWVNINEILFFVYSSDPILFMSELYSSQYNYYYWLLKSSDFYEQCTCTGKDLKELLYWETDYK